jgi:hypothetical protein
VHLAGWAHDARGADARGVGQRSGARRGSSYFIIVAWVDAAVRSGIAPSIRREVGLALQAGTVSLATSAPAPEASAEHLGADVGCSRLFAPKRKLAIGENTGQFALRHCSNPAVWRGWCPARPAPGQGRRHVEPELEARGLFKPCGHAVGGTPSSDPVCADIVQKPALM